MLVHILNVCIFDDYMRPHFLLLLYNILVLIIVRRNMRRVIETIIAVYWLLILMWRSELSKIDAFLIVKAVWIRYTYRLAIHLLNHYRWNR